MNQNGLQFLANTLVLFAFGRFLRQKLLYAN